MDGLPLCGIRKAERRMEITGRWIPLASAGQNVCWQYVPKRSKKAKNNSIQFPIKETHTMGDPNTS